MTSLNLSPGKDPLIPFILETMWNSGHLGKRKLQNVTADTEIPVVQSVIQNFIR